MACGSYSSSNYSSWTSTYWYGTSSSPCRSCYCSTRLSWRSSSYRLSTTLRHSSTYWSSTSGWCTSSNKLPAAGRCSSTDRSSTPWRNSSNWSLPSNRCNKTPTNWGASYRWSCIWPNLQLNRTSSHGCRSWWSAHRSLLNLLNRFLVCCDLVTWGQASSLILTYTRRSGFRPTCSRTISPNRRPTWSPNSWAYESSRNLYHICLLSLLLGYTVLTFNFNSLTLSRNFL